MSETTPTRDHPRAATAIGVREVALLWVLFTAVATLAELVALIARARAFGIREFGWQVTWMLPITEGLTLALVALPLVLLARRRRGVSIGLTTAALLGTTCLATMLVAGKLTLWSRLILAAGFAVQGSRWASAHPATLLRAARRGALVLGPVVVALPLIVAGGAALEAARMRRTQGAAPEGAPNVILLVLDTVRAASLALYGGAAPNSPRLERLAARGVVFDRAVATAPSTHPSHATMFTGKYLYQVRAGWRLPLPEDELTIAEALHAHGYDTGGFVANLVHTIRTRGMGQGFAHYEDFVPSAGELLVTSSFGSYLSNHPRVRRRLGWYGVANRKLASEINASLLDWLDHREQGARRPFFAFLNYFDAHTPYLPPPPFGEMFTRGPRWERYSFLRNFNQWADIPDLVGAPLEGENGAYDGALAYVDHEVGQLVDSLDRRGLLENTVIIVTADHGDEFRENGRSILHAFSLFYELLHVPLLVYAPRAPALGVPQGVRVHRAVTLRDLPATIAELARLPGARFPGHSLVRHWQPGADSAGGPVAESAGEPDGAWPSLILSQLRPSEDVPRFAPGFRGPMQALLVEDRYHFIVNGDGSEEVYDITADQWERRNLRETAEGKRVAERYAGTLPVLGKGPGQAGDSAPKR